MVQVNVDGSGNNIVGDAANEPSMTIDPVNPQNIVIGWRQFDNVLSNFRQAGFGYSTNGGQSWTFPGVINPGLFRSDPVLDCDTAGNFYYNSLTSNAMGYFCKVFKSSTGGASWNTGTDAHGGDKQWMAIDRTKGAGSGNMYVDWNESFSSCLPGAFTRSTDGNGSYGDCIELPGNPYWGTVAVGNNGEVYISGWSDSYGMVVLKSINSQYADSIPTWSLSTAYMDGQVTYGELINPVGLTGQISISVDLSDSPAKGNIYLLASVWRYSNNDSADVMFTRSTNGGLTWTEPVKVSDAPGTNSYQWFGTMSVAPNGRIDAVWLDTRDSPPDSLLSALYYSYSLNQGTNWSASQKLTPLFDSRVGWPQQAKMGDYISMISDNSKACLAWTNTLNGEQDVYYSTITPPTTGISSALNETSVMHISAYPNPFREQATIEYFLPRSDFARVSLVDICGREIKTLVSGYQASGNHQVKLDGTGIPRGYYFVKVVEGTQSSSAALVRID